MIESYTTNGEKAILYSSSDKFEVENVDNLKDIIVLQNDKEVLDYNKKLLKEELDNLSKGKVCNIGSLLSSPVLSLAILAGNRFVIHNLLGAPKDDANFVTLLYGIPVTAIFVSHSFINYKSRKEHIDDKESILKKYIDSFELFDYALSNEIKLEKDKSKKISSNNPKISLINESLVNPELPKRYTDYHGLLMDEFIENGTVIDNSFNNHEINILNNMIFLEKEDNIKKLVKH